jgi:STE24 endopeptidase
MPILLVLVLTAACMPVEWPNHLGLSPGESLSGTALATLVPLAAAFALRTGTLRSLRRNPQRRSEIGQRYDRVRRLLFFVNLGSAGGAVVVLGWGAAVWQTLTVEWRGEEVLAPFAELVVPLPYFAILFGTWLIYYDVERSLHRSPDARSEPRFWSRAGYFFHHLRQLVLLVGLPVGLFVMHQNFSRFAPETARAEWVRALSIATVPVIILFVPLFIKPLLGLKSLPPGPTRDHIEALARRLHFRYADLLVWPTHGSVMNAMIVGLIPRVRYVVFTDAILEELPPDELDAVFGHEVGHARHGHIWYYALFLILSMAVLASAFSYFGQNQEGLLLLLAAVYIFIVFGYLSRRCERQADIFGCRAVSCSQPDCDRHTENSAFPERGAGLCATGIKTCARALDRVYATRMHGGHDDDGRTSIGTLLRGVFGWLRAWQHSPMPNRVRFLHSLVDDRSREARFQWRVRLLRWGLALVLLTALLALAQAIGWRKIIEVM